MGFCSGWYMPRIKDTKELKKVHKILKPIHDDDEFAKLDDFPWLEARYDAHNNFDTWLYWVRRVYDKKHLVKLEQFLEAIEGEGVDKFEVCKKFNLHFVQFEDAKSWHELPKRSIILIDECQQFFPPRGIGSKVPEHISKFETHRHDGYDIHLVTQDPKLMDVNIRRLTGRHVHYHNPFGGKTVTRYQNSKCFDPDQWFDLKACSKKPIRHDKKFYGVYWSSELHTHKFKMPAQVFVLLALVIGVGFCVYYVTGLIASKSAHATDASSSSPVTETRNASKSGDDSKKKDPLHKFFYDSTKDIYISGSVVRAKDKLQFFHYVFVKGSTNETFHPEYLGIDIEAKSHCFALFKLNGMVKPVTCNPFTKQDGDSKQKHTDKVKAGETIFGQATAKT